MPARARPCWLDCSNYAFRILTFFHIHFWSAQATVRPDGEDVINDRMTFSNHIHWPFRVSLHSARHSSGLQFIRSLGTSLAFWQIMALVALCGLFQTYRLHRRQAGDVKSSSAMGAALKDTKGPSAARIASDPGLLRKHSIFKSYTTSTATYPSIRTFYRPHPQADKLPNKPTPLPLLVFIHGLGGSLAQFNSLLTSIVNVAPSLGVDLPGCGLSDFSPKSWAAYSHLALVELLDIIITQHCDIEAGQGVILIGHSMGCSLSVSLATSTSTLSEKAKYKIVGIVAICPKASRLTAEQLPRYQKLLSIPTPIFDLWRQWDRRGGINSASVALFAGKGADVETKKLQLKFNKQSRSAVWRRMAWGALPSLSGDEMIGGLPGPDAWAKLTIPLFLVAGQADLLTKPEEVEIIREAIATAKDSHPGDTVSSEDVLTKSAAPKVEYSIDDQLNPSEQIRSHSLGNSSTGTTLVDAEASQPTDHAPNDVGLPQKKRVLKMSVLPAPASHALLYDHSTYRTLAGLIETFLSENIDGRLSLGWQLQHLTTEAKWDVKNLAKWQNQVPVSEPIAGLFRAMKTLREIDDVHSPAVFVRKWGDKIKAVVDVSHDSPVYNPQGLEDGGIQYHKFPTVSKIPPTAEEVHAFIALIEHIRHNTRDGDDRLIGVHCHYGFNRTGFFICGYLIEREGYGVQQAVDEFKARRPPGVRHEHFLDTLFVRYCVGLKRAPTM